MFGRIAVLNNMISQEQLDEVLSIQKKAKVLRPLGLILLEKGYITKLQLKAILGTQKKLPKPLSTDHERREDMTFAYLSFKHNFIDVESIYKCIETQGELSKKGLLFRLNELFVNQNYLSLEKAQQVLDIQNQRVIECPECNTRYNTIGLQEESEFCCKKCNHALSIPEELLEANETESIEKFRIELEKIALQQHNLELENKIVHDQEPTVEDDQDSEFETDELLAQEEQQQEEDYIDLEMYGEVEEKHDMEEDYIDLQMKQDTYNSEEEKYLALDMNAGDKNSKKQLE